MGARKSNSLHLLLSKAAKTASLSRSTFESLSLRSSPHPHDPNHRPDFTEFSEEFYRLSDGWTRKVAESLHAPPRQLMLQVGEGVAEKYGRSTASMICVSFLIICAVSHPTRCLKGQCTCHVEGPHQKCFEVRQNSADEIGIFWPRQTHREMAEIIHENAVGIIT